MAEAGEISAARKENGKETCSLLESFGDLLGMSGETMLDFQSKSTIIDCSKMKRKGNDNRNYFWVSMNFEELKL